MMKKMMAAVLCGAVVVGGITGVLVTPEPVFTHVMHPEPMDCMRKSMKKWV